MPLMLAHLYTALKDAGASDESARQAAEEIAAYERDLAAIRTDLSVLKWMAGTNIAFAIGIVTILLRLGAGL